MGSWLARKTPVPLDAALLRRAQARAAERGWDAEDLIEEAVQRYLDLDNFMDRAWSGSPDDLTEVEFLELANREVHATRAERASRQQR
jgi:hypothetical protein